MAHAAQTDEELATQAEELYKREIRDKVETDNFGKYLVLDIDSGDYQIDTDIVTAMKQAKAKHPDGTFHILRIGYPVLGRMGARMKEVNG